MRIPFSSVLGQLEEAERLVGKPPAPMLNGRLLRWRERRSSERDRDEEEVEETEDKELMLAASYATWEAEMTFRLYEWLTRLEV